MSLTKLQELSNPKKNSRTPKWTSPTPDMFKPCKVIFFDPSLRATGVVALWVTHPEGRRDPSIYVQAAETFKTDEIIEVGHEGNLKCYSMLEAKIAQWMNFQNFATDWTIVHEAPPMGHVRRPESSLLGGAAVRTATKGYHLAPMIGRQKHAKFICGDANASKPVHHLALKKLAEPLGIKNFDRITNEGKRDALSGALAYAAGL